MHKRNKADKIINKYYYEILRYCKAHFQGDVYAAEDCTQEVFLLFLEKIDELDLSDNIRGWLHAAADRIILSYKRKAMIRQTIEGEGLEKAENLPVDCIDEQQSDAFDMLSADEYSLLKRYFETDDRVLLAAKLGISINTLYQRIHAIKRKIINHKTST